MRSKFQFKKFGGFFGSLVDKGEDEGENNQSSQQSIEGENQKSSATSEKDRNRKEKKKKRRCGPVGLSSLGNYASAISYLYRNRNLTYGLSNEKVRKIIKGARREKAKRKLDGELSPEGKMALSFEVYNFIVKLLWKNQSHSKFYILIYFLFCVGICLHDLIMLEH